MYKAQLIYEKVILSLIGKLPSRQSTPQTDAIEPFGRNLRAPRNGRP
jgi:hypothetical protein